MKSCRRITYIKSNVAAKRNQTNVKKTIKPRLRAAFSINYCNCAHLHTSNITIVYNICPDTLTITTNITQEYKEVTCFFKSLNAKVKTTDRE